MKIELRNINTWGIKHLIIEWDAPYLPRIGEAIEVAAFLSDEDRTKLEKTPASEYGYPDEDYDNALIAIDDDIDARVDFVRWYKTRQTGEIFALILLGYNKND